MKEQVFDIALVLKSINGKIDGLTKQLNSAHEEIVVLKKENLVLKECLAIYQTPKDSHNSSIPPSKDSLAAQGEKSKKLLATRSLREKSGKPNGGQLGHKGYTLEMASEPDSIVEHQPYFCTRCGSDLSAREGELVEIRQVFDIPIAVRPLVAEHQLIGKRCSCGHCNKIDFPKEVRSRVSYGENIRALVVYLNCIQFIPYERLTQVLQDCFGIKLSQGTVKNILDDAAEKSLVAYQEIRNRVEQSKVVGADETGENINGELHWEWVFQTPKLTYIYSDQSRGKLAIDKHFENGLPNSILVTDRHSSYFNMSVADHQLCLAHVLRNLIFLTELDKNQSLTSELAELIRDAIHKRKTELWENIDRTSIIDRFDKLLTSCTDNLHQKIIAIIKSLTKHKEYVFKFLFDPDVPYENNASERAVRNLKVKQKVSGMFKTQAGADTYCQIHSITQTAKKNNQNPFLAILAMANNY
ncbi:MAG: IS66 family transposase [Paludibacter sp.]